MSVFNWARRYWKRRAKSIASWLTSPNSKRIRLFRFLFFSIFHFLLYTPAAAAAINQIENKRLLGINEKKSLFFFSLISICTCVFFQLKIKFVFPPTLYGLFCSSTLHSGCTHFGVVIRRTIDYISSCSNSCTANQLVVAVAEREWFKSKCADPSVLPHVPHRPIRPGCASNGTERPLPTTPKSLYIYLFIIFLLYRFLTLVIYIWCI